MLHAQDCWCEPARARPGLEQTLGVSRQSAPTDRLALVAAGVTVILWASAFVAIRSAAHEFSPGALALGRLTSGSVVLGVVAWARREGWPPRTAWPGIALSGVLWFGLYMVALNWGEQKVDAGTAAMVVSLGLVVVALLSGWLLREGFPRGLLAGVGVSFAGVVVVGIATSSGTGHRSVAGVLLCLLAALVVRSCCDRPETGTEVRLGAAGHHLRRRGGRGGVPPVRRPTGLSDRRRSHVRHTEGLLPGGLPNRYRLHHLGIRAARGPRPARWGPPPTSSPPSRC